MHAVRGHQAFQDTEELEEDHLADMTVTCWQWWSEATASVTAATCETFLSESPFSNDPHAVQEEMLALKDGKITLVSTRGVRPCVRARIRSLQDLPLNLHPGDPRCR